MHSRLAYALAVGALSVTAVPALAQSTGQIKRMEGDVRIVRAGETLVARPGHEIHPKDRLVTGTNGAVGFTTTDNALYSMGPNSHLVIDEYAFNQKTHDGNVAIRFLKGTFAVVSGLLAKVAPQKTRIQTPTATIGIRGTEFVVKIEVPPELEEEILGIREGRK